jgi:hypothetical protein
VLLFPALLRKLRESFARFAAENLCSGLGHYREICHCGLMALPLQDSGLFSGSGRFVIPLCSMSTGSLEGFELAFLPQLASIA